MTPVLLRVPDRPSIMRPFKRAADGKYNDRPENGHWPIASWAPPDPIAAGGNDRVDRFHFRELATFVEIAVEIGGTEIDSVKPVLR